MKRNTITMVLGLLLAVPLAPFLYALLGGGVVGGAACLLLGIVASAASRRAVNGVVEGYNWYKYRDVYIEEPAPMRVPKHTAYEIDWTNINKGDKL